MIKREKGFTLIEVLVIYSVVVLLFILVLNSIKKHRGTTSKYETRQELYCDQFLELKDKRKICLQITECKSRDDGSLECINKEILKESITLF